MHPPHLLHPTSLLSTHALWIIATLAIAWLVVAHWKRPKRGFWVSWKDGTKEIK